MTHEHRHPDRAEICPSAEYSDEPADDDAASTSLLDLVLSQPPQPSLPPRIDGILVGRVVSLDSPDAPRVTFPNAPPDGILARAMLTLTADDIDRDVALMFEAGDPARPIVMGRMAMPYAQETPPPIEAEVDDRRVEIEAQEQLVLRCGESSITLTRSGKIIIRGTYVLSRASGANCIQGGSVQIN